MDMWPWVQKTFSDYDMPAGRTPGSFAFKIESIWSGCVVDTYFTDDPLEAERMVDAEKAQAYEVHLTHAGATEICLT